MDPEKARSMMNYVNEAIGAGQFVLETCVHDRDDLGREFRLRRGP